MATVIANELYGYHEFGAWGVDVFGYNSETERYTYAVQSAWHPCTIREAKVYYKHPDKRNEWAFPFGDYIYIIDPFGKKHRIQADYRP